MITTEFIEVRKLLADALTKITELEERQKHQSAIGYEAVSKYRNNLKKHEKTNHPTNRSQPDRLHKRNSQTGRS